MLARRTGLPVVVGKDRMEGIKKGVADFGIDLAIFDDGAQVRNVRKDVQMLVLDGSAPAASLRLLPRASCGNRLKWRKKPI